MIKVEEKNVLAHLKEEPVCLGHLLDLVLMLSQHLNLFWSRYEFDQLKIYSKIPIFHIQIDAGGMVCRYNLIYSVFFNKDNNPFSPLTHTLHSIS